MAPAPKARENTLIETKVAAKKVRTMDTITSGVPGDVMSRRDIPAGPAMLPTGWCSSFMRDEVSVLVRDREDGKAGLR